MVLDMDAAVRRLADTICNGRPPVYHEGIGEEAFARLAGKLNELACAEPGVFAPEPEGDPNARRTLRFLAAFVADDVPDSQLACEVVGILGNPNLDVYTVDEVLNSGWHGQQGAEVPAWMLRRIARALRDGKSQTEVMDELGVSNKPVEQMSKFMDVAAAREAVWTDRAIDWLERDGTVTGFADEYGVSRTTARRYLRRVEGALG